MDPTTLAAFGDELEKISGIKRALRLGDSILRKGGDQAPKNLIEAGVRAGDKAQRALIKRKISPVGYAQKHQTDKQRHNLFKVMFSKTAQQTPAGPADKDRITKNKVKALLRHGAVGAAGAGLGMGTFGLMGRPLKKALMNTRFAKHTPGKALRVGMGLAAGAGGVAALGQSAWSRELMDRVSESDKG